MDGNECGSESRGSDETNGRKNKKSKKFKKEREDVGSKAQRRGEKKKKKQDKDNGIKGGKKMQSKEAQKELRESRQWERAAVAAGGKRRKERNRPKQRVLSGTGQVQPGVVARPSRWTVPVLAAQVLSTRARTIPASR